MRRSFAFVAIISAAVVAFGATTVYAQSDMGATPPVSKTLTVDPMPLDKVDVNPVDWVTVMDITLTGNRIFAVDANVRGGLSARTPVNSIITARLFNVATGQVVPDSERLVTMISDTDPDGAAMATNDTVPISVEVEVRGQAMIQLQAMRIDRDNLNLPKTSAIFSTGTGRTTIRFL